MKKLLLNFICYALIFTMLPITSIKISAATSGYYTYTTSGTNATITSVSTSISGDVTIPSSFGKYTVTEISMGAFSNCTKITSLTIPVGIKTIDDSAFADCKNLETVNFNAENCTVMSSFSRPVFEDCSKLSTVNIGAAVTKIPDYAFYNCTALTKINMPDNVRSVGTSAFYNTEYYNNSSNWTNDVLYLGKHLLRAKPTLSGSYEILEGTLTVSNYAFSNCSSLNQITLCKSLVSVGEYAFYNCSNLATVNYNSIDCTIMWSTSEPPFKTCKNLTQVNIGADVKSINGAFYSCSSLEKVNISNIANWCNFVFKKHSYNPLYYAKKLYLNDALLTELAIPDSVNAINDYVFYNCESITSVIVPNSVKKIGTNAFYNCTSIENIDFGNGITEIDDEAFYNCRSITQLIVPDSVTRIGEKAFSACTSLESISIPFVGETSTTTTQYLFSYAFDTSSQSLKSVKITNAKTINNRAFRDCSYINKIELSSSVTTIKEYAFTNCSSLKEIILPNSLKEICSHAFDKCTALTAITLPDSVTAISDYVFSCCNAIKEITLPNYFHGFNTLFSGVPSSLKSITLTNATNIDENYFIGCSSVEHITLGDKTTSIYNNSFKDCTSLETLTLGKNVKYIEDNAFYNCSSLKQVIVNEDNNYLCDDKGILYNKNKSTLYLHPAKNSTICEIGSTVTSIKPMALTKNIAEIHVDQNNSVYCDVDNVLFSKDKKTLIKYPGSFYAEEYTIPNGTETINSKAFVACPKLKSLYISDSVTSMAEDAFSCRDLEHLYIGSGITRIDESAFFHFTSLKSVVIGDNVTHIGQNAFKGCTSLTDLTLGKNVALINYYGFNNCPIENVYYKNTEANKEKIEIMAYNYCLYTATWHYESCIGNYVHDYSLNDAHTCSICKYSRKPAPPEIGAVSPYFAIFVAKEGFEYSLNGYTWQKSNLFTDLTPGTKYTFYQRVAESENSLQSDMSNGFTIETLKLHPSVPSAPSLSKVTDTSVLLVSQIGYEYSIDGETWQKSNLFTNLNPFTKYTFYQRLSETSTHYPSEKSEGAEITTDKSQQTVIPPAPTLQSVTDNTIVLVAVPQYEYSIDGKNWQNSNIFTGLSCATEYSLYQREKETNTHYAGATSPAFKVKTDKGVQQPPPSPTLLDKTYFSITVEVHEGYEYSIDGKTWQKSNVFEGLTPNTQYSIYQRLSENSHYYTSEASDALILTTDSFVIGDLNGNGAVATDDLAIMKLFLANTTKLDEIGYWSGDINGDTIINTSDLSLLKLFLAGIQS